MPNCEQCNIGFEITDKDREFYKKIDVPEPKMCPKCRSQRRWAHINQINLYKRKCDGTDKEVVSMYSQDHPIKVYEQPYWWSDKWNELDYGQEFDFNRPFFEQFFELSLKVPRPSLQSTYQLNENAEYVNHAGFHKNSYMLFDSDYDWDCYYGHGVNKSKNCIDNTRIKECELCYECIDCVKCHGLKYSQDCDNCSSSAFLKNCIGCKHCFMCSNLKNKEYFICNKQYNKKTYEKLINSLFKHSELQRYMNDWDKFKLQFPQKYMHGVQNENVIGDYLVYSKNAEYCFDSMELWDCKYFTRSFGDSKDCMDCDESGDKVQLLYDCVLCGHNAHNLRFCYHCFQQSHDLDYCVDCSFAENSFGCVSLRRKKYCILNKQYEKEEYFDLKNKIIDYMKSTGEWGQFLPVKYAIVNYNETVAQEYFPLSEDEANKKGWKWRAKDQKEFLPATAQVPDDSSTADQSICNELFACEKCSRNYKIVEQELKFYQNHNLSIPKKCFYCRHKERFNMRNPRILIDRKCDKCGIDIKTTYSPDRPEKVYCGECYSESII